MSYDQQFSAYESRRDTINADLVSCVNTWRLEFEGGSQEPVAAFCDVLLRGGKRLRGSLAMQSYYAHGGRDEHVAIVAARVFELVQAYLLILDDIADRSDTRRGGLSAHKLIEKYATDESMKGDYAHYGVVQAMNAAVMGLHKATSELVSLDIDPAVTRQALRSLHENLAVTMDGQMNDIFNEVCRDIPTEEAIERMLTRKSAYYTILSPLELGACLAGANGLSEPLRRYSIHTGCAFQITDDVIGTFGDEDETGKGTNDDIREGKMTLLAQYGLTHTDDARKNVLETTMGDNMASDEDCNAVRQILLDTGAKDYATSRASWHKQESLNALDDESGVDENFIDFLRELTEFVTNRKS